MRERVLELLSAWIALLSQVVQNNPYGDIYDLLARPDVTRLLERGISQARVDALAALNDAWPDTSSAYYQALRADIERAYAEASGSLRDTAVAAASTVPQVGFVPGVHRPGSNPSHEAAISRARAVRAAVTAAVMWLGYRNDLTVSVARTRVATERRLAEGRRQSGVLKRWVSRKDSKVCPWCRWLDSQDPIPIDAEFSRPPNIGGHAGPRIYLDLLGPPLHPRCRCRLVLVPAREIQAARANRDPDPMLDPPEAWSIDAESVRAIPPGRYNTIKAFMHESVRELVSRRH